MAYTEQAFSDVDPFTQGYRALWDMLESDGNFIDLIPPGNRIKLDGRDRSPEKETHTTRDFPEVMLLPGPVDYSMFTGRATSSSERVSAEYGVEAQTGDRRATEILMPLQWALLRAVSSTKSGNLGLSFVHNVALLNANPIDRLPNGEPRNQWVAIATIRLDMDFNLTSDLRA